MDEGIDQPLQPTRESSGLLLPRPDGMLVRHALQTHLRKAKEPTPRRRRTGAPKSRSGCLTCKARRVKCDEQRPACARCAAVNVHCQGYQPPTTRINQSTRTRRQHLLAPCGLPTIRCPSADTKSSPLFRNVSPLPTVIDKDAVYFDYFRQQVVSNKTGFYTTSIWSSLVAAQGLEADCVRHSILAIGAFMRSVSESPAFLTAQHSEAELVQLDRTYHEDALRHHVQAVTTFRQRIQNMASSSPAGVITTTLLLIVFELLQGSRAVASSLADLATALLGEARNRIRHDSNSPQRPSTPEFKDMEWVLPSISIMNHLSYLFQPDRPSAKPPELIDDFRFPRPGRDSVSTFYIEWGRFFTCAIIFFRQTICTALKTMSAEALQELLPNQAVFLMHLQSWKTSLAAYSSSACIGSSDRGALRLARVHWLLMQITMSSCLDPTQCLYDTFEVSFRDLCGQCTDLIQDGMSIQPPTSVLLGQGLLLSLSAIARFCRNHGIRMRAIEAMRMMPRSMVAWDAHEMIDGLLGAMLLEELGRDADGFVPPESRWFWLEEDDNNNSSGEQDGGYDRIYQRLVPDSNGAPVYTRLGARPDLVGEICRAAGCSEDHEIQNVVQQES